MPKTALSLALAVAMVRITRLLRKLCPDNLLSAESQLP